MEKRRMGSGRKFYRIGLVMKALFIFLLMAAVNTFAQDVSFESYPAIPVAGSPWTLTLIVDYPYAEDVTVIPPPYSRILTLERYLKLPKLTGNTVQTAIEYRFIPITGGDFVLPPFNVITPAGVTETQAMNLTIRSLSETITTTPRIVWSGVPQRIPVGNSTMFMLRVQDMYPAAGNKFPPQEFFMPEIPPNVLLSPVPLSAEERAGGILLKVNLIPLKEGTFRLNEAALSFEDYKFNIPELQILITESSKEVVNETPFASEASSISREEELLQAAKESGSGRSRTARYVYLFVFLLFLIVTPFILFYMRAQS